MLVVDDDAAIRMLCRINLRLDGHTVAEAASPADAMAVLADGEIDVVILDLHLGSADGRELLGDIRREHPDVAVALLTGSADGDALRKLDADAVIGKPFTLDELRETVERIAPAPTPSNLRAP